ncbi:hypothetical protein J6Y73_04045 [bacterium]|nr:hypothetical protein [bacterium]
MKRFVLILLMVLLSVSLVACKGKKTTTVDNATTTTNSSDVTTTEKIKPVPVTNVDQSLQGVFMSDNESVEVSSDKLVYKGIQYPFYTYENQLVILVGLNGERKNVKLETGKVTINGFGEFTRVNTATISNDEIGVYQSNAGEVIVRSDSVTIDGKKYFILTDDNGNYIITDEGRVTLSLSGDEGELVITIGDNTYNITEDEIPADIYESVAVSLIKSLIYNVNTFEVPSFAKNVTFSFETTTDVIESSVDNYVPNKSLLDMLNGIKINGSAQIKFKNVLVSELENLLAEVKAKITVTQPTEGEREYNAQVNVQDGKVYTRTDYGEGSFPQYSISDLPTFDELDADELVDQIPDMIPTPEFPDLSEFDPETIGGVLEGEITDELDESLYEFYQAIANLEAQLSKAQLSAEDIMYIFSDVFEVNDSVLTVTVSTDILNGVITKVEALIEDKIKPQLRETYEMIKDSDLMNEYLEDFPETYEQFEEDVLGEIESIIADAKESISESTINALTFTANFDDFTCSFNLDFDIMNEIESSQGAPTQFSATYKNNIKVTLNVTNLADQTITKVNPEDYIVSYDDAKDVLNEYMPNFQYPTLGSEVEFKINKSMDDDENYIVVSISNASLDESKAFIAQLRNYFGDDGQGDKNSDYSGRYQINKYTESKILSIFAYYSAKEVPPISVVTDGPVEAPASVDGSTRGYAISIQISDAKNDHAKVTINVGNGITISDTPTDGTYYYADEYGDLEGYASWEDEDKILVIKVNGQVFNYYTYDDEYESYFYVDYIPNNAVVDLVLEDEEYAYDFYSFYVMQWGFNNVCEICSPYVAIPGQSVRVYVKSFTDYDKEERVETKVYDQDQKLVATVSVSEDYFDYRFPTKAEIDAIEDEEGWFSGITLFIQDTVMTGESE